jgi:ribonuclease H2 subunit A
MLESETKHKYTLASLPAVLKSQPCILGIDEAGRGPVLGPMVYGVAYCPVDYELKQHGFNDSKQLTEDDRERMLKDIDATESIGYAICALSPRDISRKMLRRNKYNLNTLSHHTAMALVQDVLDLGVQLEHVYVDTVGSPQKYQQMLEQRFAGIKFTVASKADSLYPIVSAASICAKVIRDERLANWQDDTVADRDFGSGYPGDPTTKMWLRNNMDQVFGYPSLIRFSWSTCAKLLEEKAVSVEWPEDPEDNENQAPAAIASNKPQPDWLFHQLYITPAKLE